MSKSKYAPQKSTAEEFKPPRGPYRVYKLYDEAGDEYESFVVGDLDHVCRSLTDGKFGSHDVHRFDALLMEWIAARLNRADELEAEVERLRKALRRMLVGCKKQADDARGLINQYSISERIFEGKQHCDFEHGFEQAYRFIGGEIRRLLADKEVGDE